MPATQEIQDEFLSTIRKGQEVVLDALKTWVETVQSVMPKTPIIQMPLADKLPKPEELVADAYNFAEHLLANQRQFAEEILKTTAPLLPGDGGQKAAK
jgi:hypothetical protein